MTAGPQRHWPADIVTGFAVYILTSLPVFLGVMIGTTPEVIARQGPVEDFLHGFCHFDGSYFESIMDRGYWYDPAHSSAVAFFPAYPVSAGWVRRVTGWSTRFALVATANAALALTFVVLAAYLRIRFPTEPLATRLTILTLVGLWPAGLFFRMAYSESLFLLAESLLLYGLARRWPIGVLAFIAGAATGIRPVGVAASAAVLVLVLSDPARGPLRKRILTALAYGPLASWGLIAFMVFQYLKFDTPIAFVLAQQQWAFYSPPDGQIPTKALRLLLAEPVWNAYVPGSSRHWEQFDPHGMPLLGVMFWNPLLFVLAVAAMLFGWLRDWLNRPELILGFGLLFIPYITRGDEMSMGSHARFAAIALPAFVVAGRLLSHLPPAATWIVFAGLTPILALWSALFAACWPLC